MGVYTPRAGLYKPGGGSTGLIVPDEIVDIDKINTNFDLIDSMLGARTLASVTSYGGTLPGDVIYARDTKYLHINDAGGAGVVIPKLPGANFYKGTIQQRDAATYVESGDHWQVPGGDEFVLDGSNWVKLPTDPDTGWVAPKSIGAGWTAGTGSNAPQVRFDGRFIMFRGSVFGGSAFTDSLTLPDNFPTPSRATRAPMVGDTDVFGSARLYTSKVVQFSGDTQPATQVIWLV